MLTDLLSVDIYRFFLVFTRLGAAMMLLPGIGGTLVSVRIRLLLALSIAFLLLPLAGPVLPPLPREPSRLVVLVISEATIGVFLGIIVQVLMSAINVTGTFIGFQVGLTNAFSFDPIAQQQSQLLTGFMSNLAMVLVFASDLHHLMLRALVDSYGLFPPGQPLPLGDFAETLSHTMTQSFRMGIQLAAPLVVFGLVFYSGLGVLSRLVPQMQVFFVAMPIQTLVGLWLLMVALPGIMLVYLRWFADGLLPYVTPR
ncbi:MAG: flagellar biosynthetic protein FliR [Actinomycetota bacterium]